MEIELVKELIGNYAFPIIMCGMLGFYVKYTHDDHREDIQRINETHNKEVDNLTTAINNNTLVIQKLLDKIGDDEN